MSPAKTEAAREKNDKISSKSRKKTFPSIFHFSLIFFPFFTDYFIFQDQPIVKILSSQKTLKKTPG